MIHFGDVIIVIQHIQQLLNLGNRIRIVHSHGVLGNHLLIGRQESITGFFQFFADGGEIIGSSVDFKDVFFRLHIFGARIQTLLSNSYNIARAVRQADLVIGCVLVPGARTPKLVTEEMVKTMRPGSVLVDVAIDQGGAIATMDRVTTHENPCFIKHGVIHYSVANMPGGVPRTSTLALTGATLPYVVKLANMGAEKACKEDPALMKGLNTYGGKLTCKAVAQAQDREYTDPTTLF